MPFEAFEDTRMVYDHPFRSWPLVRQFTDLHIVLPRLEDAVAF